ncbi:hypothetical protein TPA0909_61760 [Streptomyces albus]|nr:hypothetical protein TPA0909_61760 [Streptomyces albus]
MSERRAAPVRRHLPCPARHNRAASAVPQVRCASGVTFRGSAVREARRGGQRRTMVSKGAKEQ